MKEITVPIMENRPSVGNDPHVRLLASVLEIAQLDHVGHSKDDSKRLQLVKRLPSQLGAFTIDDFNSNDSNVIRHVASELLLTEAIESTSIVAEQVQRTVIAGAAKFKIIRDCGPAMFRPTSNALRVPLGETQRNAAIVAEGTTIKDRTQDYGYRDFNIVKYGVRPRISFEMVEDGMIDTVTEEIFYAGASTENKLNYDALTALATNAGNTTTTGGCAGAGVALTVMKEAKKLLKKDGFFADTIIMSSDFEEDLLVNTNIANANQAGGSEALRQGILPNQLLGMRHFVTDNGSATVDGTNPWEYGSNADVGAVVMEARRGCGIALRRDTQVNQFDDIVKELKNITVTMRVDVNYLHANAVAKCNWLT